MVDTGACSDDVPDADLCPVCANQIREKLVLRQLDLTACLFEWRIICPKPVQEARAVYQREARRNNSSKYVRHNSGLRMLEASPSLCLPAGMITYLPFFTRGISRSSAANSGELI
jgi:hypothetical protein